jgi:NAD(P)-dependent dehydrogenase (short-subunit alcohol dehydrogenase family)
VAAAAARVAEGENSTAMARVFVTGSSDGLGRLAARILVGQGHSVALHARDGARGREALAAVPGAEAVLTGDLASLAQTRALAERANATAPFDAVIHNAAVGFRENRRIETEDGLPHVFAVNTLAPYVLTALMRRPRRLVFVGSELHRRGDASLGDLLWERRAWNGHQAYCDSKLHDTMLAFAVARRWPGVLSNALEPGWMPTRMGGPRATGELDAGSRTQAWLAASDDPEAMVTGGYFHHLRPKKPSGAARDVNLQERLLAECAHLSGVRLPPG